MSDDYKRGYGKGYHTGKTSADKRLAAMHEEAKQVVERAERCEKQLGWGHCEDCAHYTKGGERCAWGYCSMPRGAGTPWGTWMKAEGADGKNGKLQVAMRFGCVLFKSRPPIGDSQP